MPPPNMVPTHVPEEEYPSWLTREVDTVVSIVLVFVAGFTLSLGLFFGTMRIWSGLPLLLISLVMWGVSCLGLRRLLRLQNQQ